MSFLVYGLNIIVVKFSLASLKFSNRLLDLFVAQTCSVVCGFTSFPFRFLLSLNQVLTNGFSEPYSCLEGSHLKCCGFYSLYSFSCGLPFIFPKLCAEVIRLSYVCF